MENGDYINREDAIEVLAEHLKWEDGAEGFGTLDLDGCKYIAKKQLESAPSADVVKVRHGHWAECVSLAGKSICSNCRLYWIDTDSQYDFNYCPRCGARMDGKEQENE